MTEKREKPKRAGRPASSKRLKREDCAAVAIRTIPNLPQVPCQNPFADIQVSGDNRGVPFSIRLRLERTRRAWLCFCPQCSRRVAVLYFPPGAVEPGCRACLGLVYASQYRFKADLVDF